MEYCEQLKVKEESLQAEQYRSTLIRKATQQFINDPRYSGNLFRGQRKIRLRGQIVF